MSSNAGRELLGAVWDGSQEAVQKLIDAETLRVQTHYFIREGEEERKL